MEKIKYSFEYEPIPTENNIEYVFQKLIFDVLASENYELYKSAKDEWSKIFIIIKKWLNNYINKNILEIDIDEFKYVKQKLYDLDSKYLSVDGLYAEDAYEWILQLEIILEKCRNVRNIE